MKPKAEKERYQQWDFTAHGLDNIDTVRLHREDLSYHSPLAFIDYGGNLYVSVHVSLIDKAIHARLPHPTGGKISKKRLVAIKLEDRSRWIAWAKSVKAAKWSEQKQRVTVTIPQV